MHILTGSQTEAFDPYISMPAHTLIGPMRTTHHNPDGLHTYLNSFHPSQLVMIYLCKKFPRDLSPPLNSLNFWSILLTS